MSPYRYEKLADPSASIRLVDLLPANNLLDEIHIRLIEVSLSSQSEYTALSYTWGTPAPALDESWDRESVPIFIHGKELAIRKNLEHALCHMRLPNEQKRYFWIDALSIDQSNPDEKTSQVRLMRQIYSQAEETIIWLGNSLRYVDLAFRLLNQFEGAIRICDGVQYFYRQSSRLRAIYGDTVDIQNPQEERSVSPDAYGHMPGFHTADEDQDEDIQHYNVENTVRHSCPSGLLSENGDDPHELVRAVNADLCDESELDLMEPDVALLSPLLHGRMLAQKAIGRMRGNPALMSGFESLLSYNWFRRSWVVQEVALSRNLIVMCGLHRAKWSSIATLSNAMPGYPDDEKGIWQIFRDTPVPFTLQVLALPAIRILEICNFYRWFHAGERSSWRLMQILHGLRICEATDPRDKIYSALGLGDFSDIVEPDYVTNFCEIFAKFARRMIEHQMTFEIWDYAGINIDMPDWPSWIPDWSQHHRAVAVLKHREFFNACWDSKRRFRFSQSGQQVMIVDGVLFDSLKFVDQDLYSQISIPTHAGRFQKFLENVANMHRTIWHLYAEYAGILDVATTIYQGDRPTNRKGLEKLLVFQDDNMTYGPTEEPLTRAITKTLLTDTVVYDIGSPCLAQVSSERQVSRLKGTAWELYNKKSVQFLQHASITMFSRRVFITERNFIGVGNKHIMNGDVVALIMGENVPYLLRPYGNGRYQLVGQCYVHGLMDGEAKAMMEEHGMAVQEIQIA